MGAIVAERPGNAGRIPSLTLDNIKGTALDSFETTEDAFLGGLLTIAQPRRGSRAGIDAVFLAAACPAKAHESVLDLGTGSGIVALAIAARVEAAAVAGIEIDAELCALARRNAERNDMAERARFLCADVTGPAAALFEAGLAPDSFDHAVANPPFLSDGQARGSPDDRRRRAHILESGDLERWIRCLATFVKPGGSVTLVHRADALPKLLTLCETRFGGLTVFPLFPRADAPASRILVQGRKGSRAPMRLCRGMVLHQEGRDFTPEAGTILRGGAGLDVACGG